MAPKDKIKWLYESMLSANFADDQLGAAELAIANKDIIDLDVEEKIFRLKNTNREKLPDEGTQAGPGVLHFSGMADDAAQQLLLQIYGRYS